MRRRVVARGNAEPLQHRSCGNVSSIERCSRSARERYAHAARSALHDERIALEPETVGKAREERIDRREDAPVNDVGARIRAKWASVDEDRDRRPRWE